MIASRLAHVLCTRCLLRVNAKAEGPRVEDAFALRSPTTTAAIFNIGICGQASPLFLLPDFLKVLSLDAADVEDFATLCLQLL